MLDNSYLQMPRGLSFSMPVQSLCYQVLNIDLKSDRNYHIFKFTVFHIDPLTYWTRVLRSKLRMPFFRIHALRVLCWKTSHLYCFPRPTPRDQASIWKVPEPDLGSLANWPLLGQRRRLPGSNRRRPTVRTLGDMEVVYPFWRWRSRPPLSCRKRSMTRPRQGSLGKLCTELEEIF